MSAENDCGSDEPGERDPSLAVNCCGLGVIRRDGIRV